MQFALGGMTIEFSGTGTMGAGRIGAEVDVMNLPYIAAFKGQHSVVNISGLASRGELIDWLNAVESLYAKPALTVSLAFQDPTLRVTLIGQKTGQIQMIAEVSADEEWEIHKFIYAIDQSYLPEMVQSLRTYLSDTRKP